MQNRQQKAFTMIELVFVIVIIGILSAIAIPKFAATRGDAVISKAKSTVAAIRTAVSTERQRRILSGNFTAITSLSTANGVANGRLVFDGFNGVVDDLVLEYPLLACGAVTDGECWYMPDANTYRFNLPAGGNVDFNLTSNRFNCKLPNSANCTLLTR